MCRGFKSYFNKHNDFLINIFNQQMDFFNYCEISRIYTDSPSVKGVARHLTIGESSIVYTLEKIFGKYTPASKL